MNYPHHEEAEKSILGSLILYNPKIHDALENGLKPEDFYFPKHQVTYQAILDLHKKKSPVDLVTLGGSLKERGEEELARSQFVMGLVDQSFNPKNINQYLREVQEKAQLRKTMKVLHELLSLAQQAKSLQEYNSHLQAQVLSLTEDHFSQSEKPIPEALEQAVTRILSQAKENSLGIQTGFHGIDEILGGLKPGNLVIIAGRPGMGKTAFALSLLNHLYQKKESVASFYSMEMSEEELMIRLISLMTKRNSKDLRNCSIHFNTLCQIFQAIQVSEIPVENTISDDPNITVSEIRAKCQKKLLKYKRLDLVVVDYLQLMSSDEKSKHKLREQEVSEMSRGLKQLAKELKVPVIALSQLNRSLESRPDKRPKLSDLRESGALEQDADVVAFLYRDEVYNKETESKGMGEFIIAKNRHGETGTVPIKWVPQYTAYENLPSGKVRVQDDFTG